MRADSISEKGQQNGEGVSSTGGEDNQAAWYAKIVDFTLCDADITKVNIFRLVDETSLEGWQSGLFFQGYVAKLSAAAFKAELVQTSGRCPSGQRRTSCRRQVPSVKPAPAKKPVAKKPVGKKPLAKKVVAKKPVTKNATANVSTKSAKKANKNIAPTKPKQATTKKPSGPSARGQTRGQRGSGRVSGSDPTTCLVGAALLGQRLGGTCSWV